jgi:hypothetical protein
MSQHDFTIDNQTFPATRSDINSALQALASLSSGASSPSTTFAYQLWVDTTSDPNILNVRNSANNAWIKIGEINQGSAAFILTAYAILQAGSAAAPSHSFDTDRDTGMYRAAANIIGFATNGTERVRINDSGQAEFSSGTAALPSITTIGDANTGIFFPAADTIAFVEGGAEALRIASAGQIGIGGANYGTSGQVLTSGGPAAAPSWATLATPSTSGQLIRAPQILISGTSYTTPAGCTSIYVELVGGGGGGGGSDNTSNNTDIAAGAGGGGGGYGASYISVSASTAYTIAVGAGGTAGSTSGGNGGTGGTTSIIVGATTYSAAGGTGGEGAVGPSVSGSNDNEVSIGGLGGSGGSATNTTLDLDGGCGQNSSVVKVITTRPTSGSITGVTHSMVSGGGGSSYFGGGARGQITIGTAGSAASQGGGGGSGSIVTSSTGLAGGAGGAGLIRIWEYT